MIINVHFREFVILFGYFYLPFFPSIVFLLNKWSLILFHIFIKIVQVPLNCILYIKQKYATINIRCSHNLSVTMKFISICRWVLVSKDIYSNCFHKVAIDCVCFVNWNLYIKKSINLVFLMSITFLILSWAIQRVIRHIFIFLRIYNYY